MPSNSGGGLELPKYQRSEKQQRWVDGKRRTANLIQSLWKSAGKKQRSDPAFLCLLTQCGWSNGARKKGGDATRRWRNHRIADYIGVQYGSDDELAQALSSRFNELSLSKCRGLIRTQTGITHYYNAFRPATIRYVEKNSKAITLAFSRVSESGTDVYSKVRMVASLIERLGEVSAADRRISPFNGLTPTLSCLDPQRRFPIMNERTRGLLHCVGMKPDTEGIVALTRLIGSAYDVRDAFELDAYAYGEKFPAPSGVAKKSLPKGSYSDVGLKSEINSIAQIAAKKAVIRKRHNSLINRLRDSVQWKYKLKESKFDALVVGWKKGRDLLIEAKTASEGPSGRSQVRQAIGQLYDYRFTYMPKDDVDLAVLLPTQPSASVKNLLASLGIGLLWFKGKQLRGTIHL